MNVALYAGRDAAAERLHVLSVCTGGGGLDLAVELVAPGARTVGMVEGEAFAAGLLVEAMEARVLAPCPVWSDDGGSDLKPPSQLHGSEGLDSSAVRHHQPVSPHYAPELVVARLQLQQDRGGFREVNLPRRHILQGIQPAVQPRSYFGVVLKPKLGPIGATEVDQLPLRHVEAVWIGCRLTGCSERGQVGNGNRQVARDFGREPARSSTSPLPVRPVGRFERNPDRQDRAEGLSPSCYPWMSVHVANEVERRAGDSHALQLSSSLGRSS